ncbi:hypothetical protein Y1Q_0023362 [Alligator mississippiensis]|uniref:Endonuclease/exonuclease/phosphatase domain-containing protein n=1 Tax=Alligator mississippiensis TaxID=8496 RepID=A0A151NP87_ALLMI|nr:hypothetical protein Y1Q_0023362 [Alligator mississippiensis]
MGSYTHRDHHSCGQNKKRLNFGTWNVRTLINNPKSDCPEKQTAIVVQELARHNINIAAVSKTQLAEEGQLREVSRGYTFFWKRKPNHDPCIHRVGFVFRNKIADILPELSLSVNERLMTLHLHFSQNQRATVISAFAPTLHSDEEVKEGFYSDFDNILASISRDNKVILLGDFNTWVGRDHEIWSRTISKSGVGKANANGILLLTKCAQHGLIITNTVFCQKDQLKTMWRHPRSEHWHILDYIIIQGRDQ